MAKNPSTGQKPTVLVVDDEDDILDLLQGSTFGFTLPTVEQAS